MTTNEKAVDKINDLIQINYDRKEGYENAGEKADDLVLKSFFAQNAKQSGRYIVDLGMAVENYGGVPAEKTTIGGDLHRIWMDVKNAVSSNENKTILDSCEEGEDFAIHAYKEIMAEHTDIDGKVMGILDLQLSDIQNAHNRIKVLRDGVLSVDN